MRIVNRKKGTTRARSTQRKRLVFVPSVPLWFILPATGCAPQKPPVLTPPQTPIVWPTPPDAARVQYVGEIRSSADLQPEKSMRQVWDELIHGPAAPSMLVTPWLFVAVPAPPPQTALLRVTELLALPSAANFHSLVTPMLVATKNQSPTSSAGTVVAATACLTAMMPSAPAVALVKARAAPLSSVTTPM